MAIRQELTAQGVEALHPSAVEADRSIIPHAHWGKAIRHSAVLTFVHKSETAIIFKARGEI